MRILLPSLIADMQKKKIKISDELFLSLVGMEAYAATPVQERPQKGLDAAMKLINSLKGLLPKSLEQLKIQKYKLAEVARVAAERSAERFTDADCRTVLEQAWEGSAV